MNDRISREEFLRTIGRVGIFGALTGAGVALARRAGAKTSCRQLPNCLGCREFKGCAIRRRQDKTK